MYKRQVFLYSVFKNIVRTLYNEFLEHPQQPLSLHCLRCPIPCMQFAMTKLFSRITCVCVAQVDSTGLTWWCYKCKKVVPTFWALHKTKIVFEILTRSTDWVRVRSLQRARQINVKQIVVMVLKYYLNPYKKNDWSINLGKEKNNLIIKQLFIIKQTKLQASC